MFSFSGWVVFSKRASVFTWPQVLTDLLARTIQLVSLSPELLHLEDFFAEEHISNPFQVAAFSNNGALREAKPSRPKIRHSRSFERLNRPRLEQRYSKWIESVGAHLQRNWFRVKIRWVNTQNWFFTIAISQFLYQNVVPIFSELHMWVDLKVVVLALVELLNSIPCVVGVFGFCVRDNFERYRFWVIRLQFKQLLIGFRIILRAHIVLQENVDKHPTRLRSILNQQKNCLNNKGISVWGDSDENSSVNFQISGNLDYWLSMKPSCDCKSVISLSWSHFVLDFSALKYDSSTHTRNYVYNFRVQIQS